MVEELKSGLTSEHLKYCSLEAIAHYSGIGVSRICAWVTQGERPSRRNLEKIGRAFDTPPEDVLQIISSRTIDFSRRKALNEELKSAIQSSSNRNDFLVQSAS